MKTYSIKKLNYVDYKYNCKYVILININKILLIIHLKTIYLQKIVNTEICSTCQKMGKYAEIKLCIWDLLTIIKI